EGAAIDGVITDYNFMVNSITSLGTLTNYDLIKQYLDVTQFIDYMLLHHYVANLDWGVNKNWYTARRRAPGEGFKFVPWDGERVLEGNTENTTGVDVAPPPGLQEKLVASPEYKLAFADRVRKPLFNGGALTPAVASARYTRRATEVDLAMVAESARWGDYRRDVNVRGAAVLYSRLDPFLPGLQRLT